MIDIDIRDSKRFAKITRGDYLSWKHVFAEGEWEHCFEKFEKAGLHIFSGADANGKKSLI
jgi:hypothetical protein